MNTNYTTQKSLTIKKQRFSPRQISAAITDDKVWLNGSFFHVTYAKIDDSAYAPNRKRDEADVMLLWGQGYPYAFCLPIVPGKDAPAQSA
jgi:hypothetical protein